MNFNHDNFNPLPALQDHAAMLNVMHMVLQQSQPQATPQGNQAGSGVPAGPGLPMAISPSLLQVEQPQQQQQQQPQAVGVQNTWPGLGWPPQPGMPAIGLGGQQQWMQPQVLANQFNLGHGGIPAGQVPPNVAQIANAVASAMVPLLRDERPAPPVSASEPTVRDEQFLIDALKTAKAEGLTPCEALNKLHNVKGHTAAAWQDYFLRNLEKLYPRIYPLLAGQTSVSNASPSRVRQPEDELFRSSKKTVQERNGLKAHKRPLSSPSRHGRPSSQNLKSASTQSPAKESVSRQETSEEGETAPSENDDPAADEDTCSEDEQESSDYDRPRQPQPKWQKPKPKRRINHRVNAPTRVTDDDLRAMAQYKGERLHLWDSFPTKQGPWMEFAGRKENQKRTQNAWYCVSRDRAEGKSCIVVLNLWLRVDRS
ncbi:hypothetical protein C8Q80DRAFT_1153847 [Daedaleopsis nitida]|nr:hypothetical protein C8Q80DRAFT_1153847 [Daedaleopsis nitida]